jgi:hypothetical protein
MSHPSRDHHPNGTPEGTRTPDTRFRKPLLCPPELRAPDVILLYINVIGKQSGAPAGIRTPDLQIRSLLLYPAELRAHNIKIIILLLSINGGERGIRTLETAQHRLLA